MTIKKAPIYKALSEQRAVEKFISDAPDSSRSVEYDQDDMTQITLRIRRSDLAVIDEAARARRIPRASFIRQAVFQVIDAG